MEWGGEGRRGEGRRGGSASLQTEKHMEPAAPQLEPQLAAARDEEHGVPPAAAYMDAVQNDPITNVNRFIERMYLKNTGSKVSIVHFIQAAV